MMKRIAAPMIGGAITSAALELLLYPVIFALWKERSLRQQLWPTRGSIDEVRFRS